MHHPIPFHYAERVHQQLQDMVQEGIIYPSTSLWCAPCSLYAKILWRNQNMCWLCTVEWCHQEGLSPCSPSKGPQQKLADKNFFRNLTSVVPIGSFPWSHNRWRKLHSDTWARLWTTRMPYGLTGATQTCQRGLDSILQNCKNCVDNYIHCRWLHCLL